MDSAADGSTPLAGRGSVWLWRWSMVWLRLASKDGEASNADAAGWDEEDCRRGRPGIVPAGQENGRIAVGWTKTGAADPA